MRFTDAAGRDWSLALSYAKIKRLRQQCGVNLTRLVGGESYLAELAFDDGWLLDVCWSLCADQAGQAKVSEDDFYAGFKGPVFDQARDALYEALIDFLSPAIGSLIAATRAARPSEIAAAVAKMDTAKMGAN